MLILLHHTMLCPSSTTSKQSFKRPSCVCREWEKHILQLIRLRKSLGIYLFYLSIFLYWFQSYRNCVCVCDFETIRYEWHNWKLYVSLTIDIILPSHHHDKIWCYDLFSRTFLVPSQNILNLSAIIYSLKVHRLWRGKKLNPKLVCIEVIFWHKKGCKSVCSERVPLDVNDVKNLRSFADFKKKIKNTIFSSNVQPLTKMTRLIFFIYTVKRHQSQIVVDFCAKISSKNLKPIKWIFCVFRYSLGKCIRWKSIRIRLHRRLS